ncbi:MAG: hypothetical protein KBC98_01180 [Candidatus Pacebacteria bacterium]|nr:hypothetical protein [Candidatus Paceibacterota bacterium]
MDSNFQTTFIPKKPMAPEPVRVSRPVGLLSVIAFLILLITAALGVGLFLYQQYLADNTIELEASIARAEKSFEPNLIAELQMLDKRLTVSDALISKHVALSPFFELLESTTLRSVRFAKFDFLASEDGSPVIHMTGEADGYRAIAQQSDVFGQHASVRDHMFSNFILTPKGKVSFDLLFRVSPDLLKFKNAVAAPTPIPVEDSPAPLSPSGGEVGGTVIPTF